VGLEHRRGLDLLAKIDYTLDKVGNRKSKTQSVLNPLTENYNYDAVDQLIEAKYGAARTVGYQYDAVGNRQWVSDNGTTAHYTANSDNGYTSVGGISTETDLNGNMVSVPGGAYAYDAQNRLTSATVNGVTTEFTYDSHNRVVRRTSGNGTLNLTYSGWHLIEERNATGALEQVYVDGAGIDEILVKITATGPAYYHHDGLGSTIALTGENGGLLESYRYDAFGAATVFNSSFILQTSSLVSNRFLFTGREWLSQVGLYDYRNRVYSAQIGRFLQTDPIRFAAGDVNIYRYCGNKPVNWVDPLGLCIERDGKAAIDTDGSGPSHGDPDYQPETSLKNADGSSLNADEDPYGVAPIDLNKQFGGPLKSGDKMDITIDGKTKTMPIGDFGPKGKNGEMSTKAARDLGLDVKYTKHGPVPTKRGSDADIPVKVRYYPNTKGKF
jgi:RHS repeat-associated protein